MITAKDTPPIFKQIEQLALSRNKEVYTTVSVVYECGERRTYFCVWQHPHWRQVMNLVMPILPLDLLSMS